MLEFIIKSLKNDRFKISIIVAFVVTPIAFAHIVFMNKSASPIEWKKASQVLPQSLQERYTRDFLDSSRDWSKYYQEIRALQVTNSNIPIYVINNSIGQFWNSPLCGYKGCLIVAYINNDGDWKEVFNSYFQPFTLENKPSLEFYNSFSNTPCLNITEFEATETYCFDNNQKRYFLR